MSQKDQSQPTGTPEANDISTRTRKRAKRRFDNGTIDAVAALVSRGLTESEACRHLNFEPKAWFNFKCNGRNDDRFKDRLETFRSQRIEDLIRDIEASAKGIGMKQRDWRASKFLLEILDRQRFNTSTPAQLPLAPAHVNVTILAELSRLVFGDPADEPAKALPAPKEDPRHQEGIAG